jgi:hypothetical protein
VSNTITDLEIYFEKLIDEVKHAPFLGFFNSSTAEMKNDKILI